MSQKPNINLDSPIDHTNVNTGADGSVEVEVVINLLDEVTNGPLYGGSVTVEGVAFKQDVVNPILWKGLVTIPVGEYTFEVVVQTADKFIVPKTFTYFNKNGVLKPLVMGVYPGSYLMVYDPAAHRIAKYDVNTNQWTQFVQRSELTGTDILFDFNPTFQHAYTTVEGSGPENKRLAAASLIEGALAGFWAGTVTNPVGLTYDATGKRVIVLSKTSADLNKFAALAIKTGTGVVEDALTGGFANGKYEGKSFDPAISDVIWNVPDGTVEGTFKAFSYYESGKVFLIADERIISGTKLTVIQAFTEGAGGGAIKKFEVSVGADISNITVNNSAAGGIAYFAVNRSSLIAGKIKALNLQTGVVTDLVDTSSTATIANYTDLRIDNLNQLLYISDVVSDSIYEVNLSDNKLRELSVSPAPSGGSID